MLRGIAQTYLCPIAATGDQVGGFLYTDPVPFLVEGQPVIYLGDLDWAGGQIETNTRRELESLVGPLEWERLALTREQVKQYGVPRSRSGTSATTAGIRT